MRSGGATGTVPLVRAVVRLDRVRIVVWVGAIVALVWVSAVSVADVFPTQADIDAAAVSSRNPGVIAFNGPDQGLDTLGGQVAFQIGSPGLVIVALMALLMTVRLTRGEEEAGRVELLRSLPVGRHAPLISAASVVTAMSVAVGTLSALALMSQSLSVAGSVAFGLSYVLIGLVFVGVTLVSAQITENTRVAGGIAGCVLGVSFVVRAIGDIGNGVLSWFSPIGLLQKTRPFAGERWWPFLIAVALVVGLVVAAWKLMAGRDLGAGLVAPRPGRATATESLAGPLALDLRLQRGSLIGWGFGVTVAGIAYGSIINAVESFVGDNQAMADLFTANTDASLIDAYLATSIRVVVLIGAGFAVQSMLRLRSEEIALRSEPVLAAAVSRTRWALSHLVVALGGAVVVLVVSGLSLGLSAGLVSGDLGLVPRVLGAAIVYSPAVWILVGLAVAILGLWPKGSGTAWAVLVLAFVIALLGPLLRLPGWVDALSPFDHVPFLPAESMTLIPLLVLTAIAAGLVVVGVVGLERRDIG